MNEETRQTESRLLETALETLARHGVEIERNANGAAGASYDAGSRRLSVDNAFTATRASENATATAATWRAIGEAVLDIKRPEYLRSDDETLERNLRHEAAAAFAADRTHACHGRAGREAAESEAARALAELPEPGDGLDDGDALTAATAARTSGAEAIAGHLAPHFEKAAASADRLGNRTLAQGIRASTGCAAQSATALEPEARPRACGGTEHPGMRTKTPTPTDPTEARGR